MVTPNGHVYGVQGSAQPRTCPAPRTPARSPQGTAGSTSPTRRSGNTDLRVVTFPLTLTVTTNPDGQDFTETVAIQLARPLNGVDNILSDLRLVLLLVLLAGIALAAVLGRMASRRVLAPLAEVADVAQEIGETDDLTKRLHVHADDEVGLLATNFNAMLDRLETSRAALDESVRAQRQLVADASHELRTPVTSLRTNIEVLLEDVVLEPEDRRRLLADVVEQSEELTALVGDLIELARGDQPGADTDDVRLDGVAEESLARARRNAPGIHFERPGRADAGGRGPRAPGAGHQQPARQRRAPLPARRHRGGPGRARVASRSVTTAPASTPRTSPTCLTASSAGATPGAARAAGSGWPSCARWPSSTAAAPRWSTRSTAARSSPPPAGRGRRGQDSRPGTVRTQPAGERGPVEPVESR